MKLHSLIAAAAVSAALAFPAAAAQPLTNGSFESGDLSGWTASGPVEVATGQDDAIGTPPLGEHFTATKGDYFAVLTANEDAPDSDGLFSYTTLSQTFTLTMDSRVLFDAAFLAFDYLPYDDDAYVSILGASGNPIFASNVSAVGENGNTGWQSLSVFLGKGTYTLQAGVRNGVDYGGDSKLLLDNVSVAVPEPQSWALMILGFLGVGAALRTRRPASALKA